MPLTLKPNWTLPPYISADILIKRKELRRRDPLILLRLVQQVNGIMIDVRSRKLKDWIDYLVTYLFYTLSTKERSKE